LIKEVSIFPKSFRIECLVNRLLLFYLS